MSRRRNQRGGNRQPLVVSLLSSDNQLFQVSEPVARRSGVICSVLEDIGARDPIPLLNVPAAVLKKVRARALLRLYCSLLNVACERPGA